MFKRAVFIQMGASSPNKDKAQNIFETTHPSNKKTQKPKSINKTPPPKKSEFFLGRCSHSPLQTGAHWNQPTTSEEKKKIIKI